MKIELHEITVRDVFDKFVDKGADGVYGYSGKLDIRPQYQREFIYDDKKKAAVIDSINHGYPLNVLYWAVNKDKTYEVMDGQQRILSICKYIAGSFAVDYRFYFNLNEDEKAKILNYKLMVYFCSGTESEKLDWFRIINIAGMKLTDQELRNAVYTGPWLSHAKTIFSKSNCAAYNLAKDYVPGSPIRQELLETAIRWKSKGEIEKYMAEHQHDPNANALWTYFKSVIDWVKLTFPKYRKEMKGIDWGGLYDQFGGDTLDTADLERQIETLMMDDDVTSKKGIYTYVLTRDERHLNIRAFTPAQKRSAYERQKGKCSRCRKQFQEAEMEADHITPWSEGGRTEPRNCQMLCRECNRRKGAK